MEGESSSPGLKAYSLEISILVAAILISSSLFVAVGQLKAIGIGAAGVTGAVVAAGSQPSTQGAPVAQPTHATATPIQVSLAGKPIRGDASAPITIVEFSDFQCPFCKRAFPTVEQVLHDYPGKVRLIYKHYPLDFHVNAQVSAEAYECALAQNKGWEYHDKLFTVSQPDGTNLAVADHKRYAQEMGLDTARFNTCLDNHEKLSAVQADQNELNGLGPQLQAWGVDGIGTPFFLLNGEPLVGAQPFSAFKAKIDQLLAR